MAMLVITRLGNAFGVFLFPHFLGCLGSSILIYSDHTESYRNKNELQTWLFQAMLAGFICFIPTENCSFYITFHCESCWSVLLTIFFTYELCSISISSRKTRQLTIPIIIPGRNSSFQSLDHPVAVIIPRSSTNNSKKKSFQRPPATMNPRDVALTSWCAFTAGVGFARGKSAQDRLRVQRQQGRCNTVDTVGTQTDPPCWVIAQMISLKMERVVLKSGKTSNTHSNETRDIGGLDRYGDSPLLLRCNLPIASSTATPLQQWSWLSAETNVGW